MAKKKDDGQKIVADNRKARHLYFIESTLEAGLMLAGSEVKNFDRIKVGDAVNARYRQSLTFELRKAKGATGRPVPLLTTWLLAQEQNA